MLPIALLEALDIVLLILYLRPARQVYREGNRLLGISTVLWVMRIRNK